MAGEPLVPRIHPVRLLHEHDEVFYATNYVEDVQVLVQFLLAAFVHPNYLLESLAQATLQIEQAWDVDEEEEDHVVALAQVDLAMTLDLLLEFRAAEALW